MTLGDVQQKDHTNISKKCNAKNIAFPKVYVENEWYDEDQGTTSRVLTDQGGFIRAREETNSLVQDLQYFNRVISEDQISEHNNKRLIDCVVKYE